MSESDLTELERRAVGILQGRRWAPFGAIQSELKIGTEATEELVKNLQHKGVIETAENPLSNFSNLDESSTSNDIQSLTFRLTDAYQE